MRFLMLALALAAAPLAACRPEGAGRGGPDEAEDVRIDEDLGSLQVANTLEEPVAIYLDGQEIFTVAPGRSYTFRNMPTGEVTLYGVGRVSQKHYGLPELTIVEGGDYEWTIRP
jgi:hypothetical protein